MIDERLDQYVQPSRFAVIADMEMHGLSFNEYFNKVDEMIENLRYNWKQEQRVRALKIAIQLSKLLADTNQLKLYSKKYKIITNLLDEFGQLVHLRLQSVLNEECDSHQGSNRDNSLQDGNREKACELCKNWFLKVASIRELVPRFYTELCILETCDILLKPSSLSGGLSEELFFSQSLRRLTKAAWGFGDPIVALHARYYLCKVADRLLRRSEKSGDTNLFELIMANLEASTTFVSQLNVATVMQTLHVQNIELVVFFDLNSGPIQSILNLITLRNDVYDDEDEVSETVKSKLETMFDCLMSQAKKSENSVFGSVIILNSILRAFPPDIIANHANQILDTIQATYKTWKNTQDRDMYLRMIISTIYLTLEAFGLSLDRSDAFERNIDQASKECILKSIETIQEDLFQFEQKTGDPISTFYLRCFSSWISYVNRHIGYSRLSSMLDPFIIRIKKNRQHANNSSSLLELIKILISNKKTLHEFRDVFSLKSFKQLLELICKDDQKLYASEWILETIRASLKLSHQQDSLILSDRVTINFLLDLFATINDSLGLLSSLDDIDHLSHLVIYFLEEIPVLDYREHLEFFSRCRGLLGNLNLALEYLARRVLNLAEEHRKQERKRSIRQNYLNGCLAYTFITIPAINSPSTRLDLFLAGSRLALSQMSLSMADYYLKQTLNTLNSSLKPYGTEHTGQMQKATIESSRLNISRQILDRVNSLINLVIEFEDNVDLKHKLVLTELIKDFFHDDSSLLLRVKRLNLFDDISD